MKADLTFVTTVLALGLVDLLHSEAVSAFVLARNTGSAQSKTTGIEPAGGVAAGFLLTACDAFTTPTAVMVNRNGPESNPGEAAGFNITSAAPTAGQINQAFRAGLVQSASPARVSNGG